MRLTSKFIRQIKEAYETAPVKVEEPKDSILLCYRKFLKKDGLSAICAKVRKTSYGDLDTTVEISGKYGDNKTIFSAYGKNKENLDELDAIQTALGKVRRKLSKEIK